MTDIPLTVTVDPKNPGNDIITWTPIPGVEAYRLKVDGRWASNSFQADKTSWRVKRGQEYVVRAFGGIAEGVYPAAAPPPPPSSLPFAEAQLRAGFKTLTTADIPVGVSRYTLPTNDDYLIDLGGVKRDRGLKVFTKPGQRVHTKNVWCAIDAVNGIGAYDRSGFGYRPASLTAAPADHLSLTGHLVSGAYMADGITFGDSGQTGGVGATKVTLQNCRVENASMSNGGTPAYEPNEHCDAFQMQGPLTTIEFGNCTFAMQWTAAGKHAGKGFMLNGYSANNSTYTVDCKRVNFRDFPGSTNCGDVWIKDSNNTTLLLEDVYYLYTKVSYDTWPAQQGTVFSDLFLNTAQQGGPNQGWVNSGGSPNRVASFPVATKVSGVVREGLPAEGDYVTRASLGF